MKPIRIKRNSGKLRQILELKKGQEMEIFIDNEEGLVYKKIIKCIQNCGK